MNDQQKAALDFWTPEDYYCEWNEMADQQKAALDFLTPEERAAEYVSYAKEYSKETRTFLALSAEWLRVANAIKGLS